MVWVHTVLARKLKFVCCESEILQQMATAADNLICAFGWQLYSVNRDQDTADQSFHWVLSSLS